MTATLDASALQAIHALAPPGEPNLVVEVVTVYLDDTRRLLDDLRNAASRYDWSGVARCAHTLKSSSSQIGARRLAEIFGALERAARAGGVESFGEILTRIGYEFEGVRASLHDELRIS